MPCWRVVKGFCGSVRDVTTAYSKENFREKRRHFWKCVDSGYAPQRGCWQLWYLFFFLFTLAMGRLVQRGLVMTAGQGSALM